MADSKYGMERIDAMDGHEFEHFIATLLRKQGYEKVEVTPGSGDQGVDVLAEKEGVRYAVQCKCYSSDLGNTPVQEVNTGKMVYQCHVGIVVTNRYFTQSAREAAKATGVLLWDRSKLEKLIAQAEFEVEPPKQQSDNSFTLWSGSPLLKRGGIALRDKEWKKASQFFERVLNTDPENAEAYLGLVMAAEELSGKLQFEQFYVRTGGRFCSKNMEHTREFASPALKAWFSELEKQIGERHVKQQERRIKEQENAKICLAPIRETLRKCPSMIFAGGKRVVGLRVDGTVIATFNDKYGKCRVHDWSDIIDMTVPEGGWEERDRDHIIGLKADGTVVAIGHSNYRGVNELKDIVAIAATTYHVVGLKSDGTVVATGSNEDGRCNVQNWKDVVAIAVDSHTVGLKLDGTVVATGNNKYGQCDVQNWKDVVAIAVDSHTVGLKSDGTVVATGNNEYGQCDVQNWKDVVSIAVAFSRTIGLKSDGTVVATGYNERGQCDVQNWKDIVDIAAAFSHTVGLKSDGTVVATGGFAYGPRGRCSKRISEWRNIVAIAAGYLGVAGKDSDDTTVGLKSDGTVLVVGDNNEYGQCDTFGTIFDKWKLFKSGETLEQELAEIRNRRQERAEAERRRQEEERAKKRAALEDEQVALQTELANLKGLFTGRRRREVEARLAEIESALKQ